MWSHDWTWCDAAAIKVLWSERDGVCAGVAHTMPSVRPASERAYGPNMVPSRHHHEAQRQPSD